MLEWKSRIGGGNVVVVLFKVIFLVTCVALTFIVLWQKGKVAGLSGAIGGAGETYWGKNKSRSKEGNLPKVTVGFAVTYIVVALLLNII